MKRKGTSCKFLKAPTNSLRTQTKLILLCSQSFHESICTWVSISKIVQITTGSFLQPKSFNISTKVKSFLFLLETQQ